jgi:transcriptional regulator GlxA family with amidase domain
MINIAFLIYPGVELIDMNGPIDVFVKANRINKGRYQLFTVAESAEYIDTESSAVRITPQYTLYNCPKPDIIVIPGQIMPEGSPRSFGMGSDNLIAWIKEQAQLPGVRIMSVCVGAYILANTGLLDGKRATTHYGALPKMQHEYKNITFIKNERFIADGNFVTTGGVTSGIDGALYLVGKLDGPETAEEVANIMVYNREAPLPPKTILQ